MASQSKAAFQALDEPSLANVPAILKEGKKFVCWREEVRDGKPTKIPVDPHTGNDAESDNPATWGTIAQAVAYYKAHTDTLRGIGRMFDPADGIMGVDFDKCLDGQGNVIASHVAATWLPRLNSYTEISPSGTGVKVWLKASHKLDGKTGRRDSKLGVEIYRERRYFTITGRRLPQFSANVEPRQSEVDGFVEAIFPAKKTEAAKSTPRFSSTATDTEIIERASKARNGEKFRDLWAGNWQAHYGSQSEADCCLCGLLWFWTGGDREAVARLFTQSGLMRQKWNRADYQQATLDKVCNGDVYQPGRNGNASPQASAISAETIKGAILAVLTDGKLTPSQRNDAVAGLIVEALTKRGAFYYHAQHRDFATAMFFDGETKRLERVQSDAFLAWLSEWTGINRSAHLFKFVQAAIETASLSGPHTSGIIPESFWASRPSAFYLSNGDGQLVKITAKGVELADNGTDGVVFGAGATLTAWTLTEPRDPFASCGLFRDGNFADDHGARLLKLWALSFATSPVCKPPLVASGPIRSGKTRIIRGVAELYGLPQCVEEPSDTEKSQTGFWVSLDAGGLYALDNVDTRVKWLADAIASASTGAGVFPRKLYTDTGRVEMRPRGWLALTTCNATFAADAGLADRLLVVRMNQRDGETSDEALSAEIVANRNAGLSWIAETLATALADTALFRLD